MLTIVRRLTPVFAGLVVTAMASTPPAHGLRKLAEAGVMGVSVWAAAVEGSHKQRRG